MDHQILRNMDRSQHLTNNYYNGSYSETKCKVTLKNKDLWKKFHELQTEMIITKSGRRMFPSLHVQVTDLDPRAHYCILLEIIPASRCRYKYSNCVGWAPAGTEEAQSPHRMYLHPESPATGEYWMSQPISFGRLKLTNTPAPPPGHIVLSSMHKYQSRIIITKTPDKRSIAWAPQYSVVFPETQFIAVTAYQNDKITKLKIDNNPFAKGFRENGQSKSKRKRGQYCDKSEDEKSPKQPKIEAISPQKLEDDRISSCSSVSSSSSPEVFHNTGSFSPELYPASLPMPYSYKSVFPAVANSAMNMYSYFYSPYPVYNPSVWGSPSHFYYQQSLPSPPTAEDLTVHAPIDRIPRKLTDFSIRAITGCL